MKTKPLFSKPVKRQTLAEQLAEEIKGLIISGKLKSGTSLPSEVELAEQYGVSRAVVRDATRVIMALGLVEVIHGRGVFVTQAQNDAFGEALLLVLQRSNASVWDVEQFEMMLFPEVVSLVAVEASDDEIQTIREQITAYVQTHNSVADRWDEESTLSEVEQENLRDTLLVSYRSLIEALFEATHNKVIQTLAKPLLNLRNVRDWEPEESAPIDPKESESRYFQIVLEAIETRDPLQARQMIRRLMELPQEAVEIMKQTPIGGIPHISGVPSPISFTSEG
jgi:GntR family transcriptional repressor for pyruvate dehydrogenase complex